MAVDAVAMTRAPRRQRGEWHSRRLREAQRLWGDGRFALIRNAVLRPAAAPEQIRINWIAYFQSRNFRTGLRHNSGHIITENKRQMRSEFLRVLAAKNKRVGRINAARDHTHEDFVLLRLGHGHIFVFQYFRPAVFVRDDCLHRLLFGSGHR